MEFQQVHLTTDQIRHLKNGLHIGMGVARSCLAAGIHPEKLTDAILEKEAFLHELKKEVTKGYQEAVTESHRIHSPKQKSSEMEKKMARSRVEAFITRIVLWGEARVDEEEDLAATFLKALVKHGDVKEAQVACALSDDDVVDLIVTHPTLHEMVLAINEKKQQTYG